MAKRTAVAEKQDQNLAQKLAAARARGNMASMLEPRASEAVYDAATESIKVLLKNGATFSFPVKLMQGLAGADSRLLAEVEVTPSGEGLHWETLDADFSLPALIDGIFGTKNWMAEIGREGGKSSSEAKSEASRQNGKKGGRPPKAFFAA